MSKHTNKRKRHLSQRSHKQESTVQFPLPFVMLLSWIRPYDGDEECSCGASPDYEVDSFIDAEHLLEAKDPAEKDLMLLSEAAAKRCL